ncbi:unnamed protein product [Amoebophrya sp. A120]|nr:unnamed protein product [Amoebophrya sp. A120]|eukprot:GSA120T00006006001.1
MSAEELATAQGATCVSIVARVAEANLHYMGSITMNSSLAPLGFLDGRLCEIRNLTRNPVLLEDKDERPRTRGGVVAPGAGSHHDRHDALLREERVLPGGSGPRRHGLVVQGHQTWQASTSDTTTTSRKMPNRTPSLLTEDPQVQAGQNCSSGVGGSSVVLGQDYVYEASMLKNSGSGCSLSRSSTVSSGRSSEDFDTTTHEAAAAAPRISGGQGAERPLCGAPTEQRDEGRSRSAHKDSFLPTSSSSAQEEQEGFFLAGQTKSVTTKNRPRAKTDHPRGTNSSRVGAGEQKCKNSLGLFSRRVQPPASSSSREPIQWGGQGKQDRNLSVHLDILSAAITRTPGIDEGPQGARITESFGGVDGDGAGTKNAENIISEIKTNESSCQEKGPPRRPGAGGASFSLADQGGRPGASRYGHALVANKADVFYTYIIADDDIPVGEVCLNGAAAHRVRVGDLVQVSPLLYNCSSVPSRSRFEEVNSTFGDVAARRGSFFHTQHGSSSSTSTPKPVVGNLILQSKDTREGLGVGHRKPEDLVAPTTAPTTPADGRVENFPLEHGVDAVGAARGHLPQPGHSPPGAAEVDEERCDSGKKQQLDLLRPREDEVRARGSGPAPTSHLDGSFWRIKEADEGEVVHELVRPAPSSYQYHLTRKPDEEVLFSTNKTTRAVVDLSRTSGRSAAPAMPTSNSVVPVAGPPGPRASPARPQVEVDADDDRDKGTVFVAGGEKRRISFVPFPPGEINTLPAKIADEISFSSPRSAKTRTPDSTTRSSPDFLTEVIDPDVPPRGGKMKGLLEDCAPVCAAARSSSTPQIKATTNKGPVLLKLEQIDLGNKHYDSKPQWRKPKRTRTRGEISDDDAGHGQKNASFGRKSSARARVEGQPQLPAPIGQNLASFVYGKLHCFKITNVFFTRSDTRAEHRQRLVVDPHLARAANLLENSIVHLVSVDSGARWVLPLEYASWKHESAAGEISLVVDEFSDTTDIRESTKACFSIGMTVIIMGYATKTLPTLVQPTTGRNHAGEAVGWTEMPLADTSSGADEREEENRPHAGLANRYAAAGHVVCKPKVIVPRDTSEKSPLLCNKHWRELQTQSEAEVNEKMRQSGNFDVSAAVIDVPLEEKMNNRTSERMEEQILPPPGSLRKGGTTENLALAPQKVLKTQHAIDTTTRSTPRATSQRINPPAQLLLNGDYVDGELHQEAVPGDVAVQQAGDARAGNKSDVDTDTATAAPKHGQAEKLHGPAFQTSSGTSAQQMQCGYAAADAAAVMKMNKKADAKGAAQEEQESEALLVRDEQEVENNCFFEFVHEQRTFSVLREADFEAYTDSFKLERPDFDFENPDVLALPHDHPSAFETGEMVHCSFVEARSMWTTPTRGRTPENRSNRVTSYKRNTACVKEVARTRFLSAGRGDGVYCAAFASDRFKTVAPEVVVEQHGGGQHRSSTPTRTGGKNAGVYAPKMKSCGGSSPEKLSATGGAGDVGVASASPFTTIRNARNHIKTLQELDLGRRTSDVLYSTAVVGPIFVSSTCLRSRNNLFHGIEDELIFARQYKDEH